MCGERKWVLDVGCGSGWLAAQLADAGAHVVGIDGSAELIRRARARFPAVQWLLHDLRDGLPKLPDHRPIDIVVAHMSVMDFDPLLPLFNDLGFLVPTGSRLIITMPHPAFFNYKSATEGEVTFRKVRNYLRHETWHIESYGGHNHYHRPLSYYVNLIADAGFALVRFDEPERKDATPVFCLLISFGELPNCSPKGRSTRLPVSVTRAVSPK